MPTYEYACRDCGRHLEVVQSFSEKPLTKCPTCKGRLKKVFSPVGIVLKGSGFYKTDSRPAGSGKSKSESTTAGKSETSTSSSDGKGDTKGEKKAEKKASDNVA